MKRVASYVLVFLAMLVSSCNDLGEKVSYGKTEVYYTSTVSRIEAENLLEFLKSEGFNREDEAKKTLQLSKYKDRYQLKIILKDKFDMSYETEETLRKFAERLSEYVFSDAPVKLYLCDNRLNVLWSMDAEQHFNYEIAE